MRTDSAARLVPIAGTSGEPREIGAGICRIGKRQELCEICLSSGAVSRLHARLEWNGKTHLLSDLRSRNGTFLNETALDAGGAYALSDGDCVRFADMAYRYERN